MAEDHVVTLIKRRDAEDAVVTSLSDYSALQETIIRECQRTPFAGTGKPEPLKNDLKGFWSRRATKADRLVYRATAGAIEIVACRFHDGDRCNPSTDRRRARRHRC